jgi:hypothetical protein
LVLPDTLLGPEATGPRAHPEWGGCRLSTVGLGVLVVALLWWWGVVFDSWIVVASIKTHSIRVVCVGCNANFSDTRMQFCLSLFVGGGGVCG